MSDASGIPPARRDEFDAIVGLLLDHAEDTAPHTDLIAARIAAACMDDHHLWQAMGLESRAELRRIFETHFPALAEANDRDMRWKRFLYKRLCGWSGFSA